MSRFQAGALVVYGNLGVHEVEGSGCGTFAMSPPESITPSGPIFRIPTTAAISPRQKRVFCAR